MYRMAWTDERMDDFAKHTDRRFDAVDRRFDSVDRRFDSVDRRFDEVDRRLDGVDKRLESFDRRFEQIDAHFQSLHQTIHRTMLQLGISLVVTIAIGFVGVVATQL
jgi:archaellum component FlaC